MAIPTRIDLPRFIAASLGLPLVDELSPDHLREAAIGLGAILGATSEESVSFWESVQSHLETVARRLADPTKMVSLDRLLEEQSSLLKQWFTSLGEARSRELADTLGNWIEQRLVLPADDFFALFNFFAAHFSARRVPDQLSRSCILYGKYVGLALFTEHAANMALAQQVWRPMPAHSNEKKMRALTQAQGRISRNLRHGLSELSEDPELQRKALEDVVKAWHEAFETVIHNVCLLFWLVKRKKGDPVDPAKAPKQKGVLFDDVVKWCEREGIPFPFYEDTPRVRNPSEHCQWYIDDARRQVTFTHSDDETKDVVLSFDDVRWHALHDTVQASMFPVGLLLALLEQQNVEGVFDQAWARLTAKVDENVLADSQPELDDDLDDDGEGAGSDS